MTPARIASQLFVASASLILGVGCCLSLPAQAVVVWISGSPYDILVTKRGFDDEPSLFTATSMPWFTGDPLDNSLAYDFAQAVGTQLGVNTYPTFPGPGGPLFAYADDPSDVFAVFQDGLNPLVQNEIQVVKADSFNYAYLNPDPVPAPLPFAGAVAFFRWSRSLRSRQRRSPRP